MQRSIAGILVVTAGFQVLAQGGAQASGYGLREHSTAAMGAAYAGASATASDPSFMFYNPAAISGVGRFDFSASAVAILPTSDASYTAATTSAGTPTGGSTAPDEFIDNAIIPALGVRARLSPRLSWGLAVNAPWGLSTEYDSSWAGRYYALKSKLVTINIMSALAYEISPQFTIAGGVQAQYADGELTSAIDTGTLGALNLIPGSIPGAQDSYARYKGDDWGYGFTLGAIANLSESVTIGLAFRSEIRHRFDGPLTFSLDSDGIGATINALTGLFDDTSATARLTTPAKISGGARLRLNDRWTALVETDWTKWSTFRELRIDAVNPAQPDDVTTANWNDTWFGAIGFEYMANPDWTLRFGAAFDESPTSDATREPRIPDYDRFWLSAGATYQASEQSVFNFAFGHLFIPESEVDLSMTGPGNALRGNLEGQTDSAVYVLGLQFVYRVQ